MSIPAVLADHAPHPAPEDDTVTASFRALHERVESIAEVIDVLRPAVLLAQQAPAVAAMLGDTVDEVMRTAIDSGIDVERGVLNGVGAALRFGATMDAQRVASLEALLESGVLDPAALQAIGMLGRTLVDTASAPSRAIGPMGLLKALGDPDVQRALGFLVDFAGRFGRRLQDLQTARP
jgi:hypothetical protein